jgi:hypothetical protein
MKRTLNYKTWVAMSFSVLAFLGFSAIPRFGRSKSSIAFGVPCRAVDVFIYADNSITVDITSLLGDTFTLVLLMIITASVGEVLFSKVLIVRTDKAIPWRCFHFSSAMIAMLVAMALLFPVIKLFEESVGTGFVGIYLLIIFAVFIGFISEVCIRCRFRIASDSVNSEVNSEPRNNR